jgi:hypothetical protein
MLKLKLLIFKFLDYNLECLLKFVEHMKSTGGKANWMYDQKGKLIGAKKLNGSA